MESYWKKVATYHKRYCVLYLVLPIIISLFYIFKWPTPASLLLEPLGLKMWSAGMTRGLVRLLHGDVRGAWDYNPLLFLVLVLGVLHLFVAPLVDKRGENDDTFTR